MKDKNLHIRLSEKRLNNLRTIAVSREKTITQMVEEWIDRLSDKSIDWLRTYVNPPIYPNTKWSTNMVRGFRR